MISSVISPKINSSIFCQLTYCNILHKQQNKTQKSNFWEWDLDNMWCIRQTWNTCTVYLVCLEREKRWYHLYVTCSTKIFYTDHNSLWYCKNVMTKTGQDYEICPYATFSLPGGTNSTQTMDYSMQFQTFSQQECYAGQPRPSTSGYGGSKSNKDYYSRVRAKSSSTSRTPTDCKVTRTSKSPPDGLSLGKSE